MAIYKPSNFYPHLQEVDLTKTDGNVFSCQVNTDGAMASGARLTISSEDNVLLYENLYQFADETEKHFIENRGFMEMVVEPYLIENSNIIFEKSVAKTVYYRRAYDGEDFIYYDELGKIGERVFFETLSEAEEVTSIVGGDGVALNSIETEIVEEVSNNIITINSINFITLHPEVKYDERQYYCPYNFYNVKLKDAYCFALKFVNKTNNEEYLYDFKDIQCVLNDNNSYKIIITIPASVEMKIENIEDYNCYVVLVNDKDYIWDVKIYEHLFSENIDKGTLVTDGYVSGSTKSVIWWNEKMQTENTLFNKKEIKEDYYIEVNATQDNSNLFEDQVKMGRITKGVLDESNINSDKTKFKLPLEIVDVEMYKVENIYLYIELIGLTPLDKRIKSTNYFKIKELIKEDEYTSLLLEDLIIQNLIFDLLGTASAEDGEIIKYSIVYKKREKITWITENLGFDKNINKIEVEGDFDVNLNDNSVVDVYGGNNYNTNYSFFGVRDSDINVNDIYVRFPGYQGADFNGNAVNDCLDYYDKPSGTAVKICEHGASHPLELTSDVGLCGSFFQHGTYYYAVKQDENTGEITKEDQGIWGQTTPQPISLYGKNVPYKVFENNTTSQTYGCIDVFNPKSLGTAYCNYGFCIHFNGPGYVYINGDKTYGSSIPESPKGSASGNLFFYLDLENEWSMYAVGCDWGTTGGWSTDWIWQFPDFPKPYISATYNDGRDFYVSPDEEDQVAKKYKIGKINYIEMDFFGDSYAEKYNQYLDFYYYSSTDFVSNIEDEEKELISGYASTKTVSRDSRYTYFYPQIVTIPASYCKLFKVTNYDYETGEFVIAGGLERSILNTDKYEVWQRTASENMTNEYNITEIGYSYTRIYPPHDKYDDVAYVGDTKILREGIKIMNNTKDQIFIQPNVNFYSDEYNYPYLILDNYNERIEFPYVYKIYDGGFTIQDRTINTLDGSQWLLNYTSQSNMIPKCGLTYKLYIDTCKATPSNWFYGRNIANITMRSGEYNYIKKQLDNKYVEKVDFDDFKKTFKDITEQKIGKNCLIQCVDVYFMATYDYLSTPIKRYRYKIYDSSMNLVSDSEYIYDTDLSYGVRGLRNEEVYLLSFELEDQLGYVYTYEEKFIAKYTEYETSAIQLQLTVKESQGCVFGDFITMKKAIEDIIADRDTYDEDGKKIPKGTMIKQGTVYADLCMLNNFEDFGCSALDDIYIYRRNTQKLLSFVCKINLTRDKIITGEDNAHKYGFIDYGVYNNEYYDYVVILKSKDSSEANHYGCMSYTYTESRCKTYFNGWTLTDIEKDNSENNYYVVDYTWNFRYNLESEDLTQNTSVIQWNTLGKYANVYVGDRNFISSGLTCLLGDVGTYLTYDGENIKERFGYFEQPHSQIDYEDIYNIYTTEVLTNNIDRYLEWKDFVKNGNPKLLKDYKGNMWIVQILENPAVKNTDASNEQLYTISFKWVEITDWRKYPILGKHISYDTDAAAISEVDLILNAWNYNYNDNDINYSLVKLNDNYDFSQYTVKTSPFYVNGIIALATKSFYGILNESYYLENTDIIKFSSLSNIDVQNFYNSIKDITNKGYISPFMIKVDLDSDYEYPQDLRYLNFEQYLGYENNSIDFMCCGMNLLNGVNIVFNDSIKTARYAFAGTSLCTNEQYNILINTNNYINTYGILDDVVIPEGEIITIKWLDGVDDPDLVTYAELYEQYWNNEQIILDCPKLNFVIDEWTLSVPLSEITDTIVVDNVEYKKIILKSYNNTNSTTIKTSLYIPKFIKIDGESYLIELSDDFYIN